MMKHLHANVPECCTRDPGCAIVGIFVSLSLSFTQYRCCPWKLRTTCSAMLLPRQFRSTLQWMLFFFLIIINFRTALHAYSHKAHQRVLLHEGKEVAKKYLKTSFIFDLIAGFPMELLSISHLEKVGWRFRRLVKVLSAASRFGKLNSLIMNSPFSTIIRMAQLFVLYAVSAHCAAA